MKKQEKTRIPLFEADPVSLKLLWDYWLNSQELDRLRLEIEAKILMNDYHQKRLKNYLNRRVI